MLIDLFDDINNDVERVEHKIEKTDKFVLFADDSRFIRTMIEKLSRKMGIRYKIYENGKEMFENMQKIPADEIGLIITDLEMPVMGGKEFIKMKNNLKDYKNIPLIVHTNMANDIMATDLKSNNNIVDVLGKIDMLKLSESIKNYIR